MVTDLAIARDRRNLAVRAFELLAPVEGIEFRIRSDVPLSGGLGTSAAAIVAGLVAADSMYELDADLLGLADAGWRAIPTTSPPPCSAGFVLCADGRAERFDVPAGLEAVLVVPHEPVRTAAARAALPAEVPIADAVFNVAHAGLLVLGLVARRLGPRGARARRPAPPAAPRAASTRGRWRSCGRARSLGALGATISGAGPTVLCGAPTTRRAPWWRALEAQCAGWADVRRVPFEARGADVVAL